MLLVPCSSEYLVNGLSVSMRRCSAAFASRLARFDNSFASRSVCFARPALILCALIVNINFLFFSNFYIKYMNSSHITKWGNYGGQHVS